MKHVSRQYPRNLEAPGRLRRALAASFTAHLTFAFVAVGAALYQRPLRQQVLYTVQFSAAQPDAQTTGPVAQGQPEAPKPEPPKPEAPKPEPPKPEPPKPEPEKPKPEPEKPKPKPEPKKPKEKQEKKPEPAKQPKKPSKETKPKLPDEPIPLPSGPPVLPGLPQGVPGAPSAVSVKGGLPSVLSGWGQLVQMKVEKYWEEPSGVRLDLENNSAEIAFWVDRQGNLIGEPEVIKKSGDPALDETGLRAIKLSAPLPPLPDDFTKAEQQVVYVFRLTP